jgi:hypothetical protein
MSLVRIWEQTAIKRSLGFTTEKDCVYFALRTEPLFNLQVRLYLQCRAMAKAVSRRSPRAETQVWSKINPYRAQNDTRAGFPPILRVFRYSPLNILPPVHHTYFEVVLIWEPSKSDALSVTGKHCIEKHFAFAFRLLSYETAPS